MKRSCTLVLPEKIARLLRRHLFPGDGLEAAALLLCAASGERRVKLLGREVVPVPYGSCTRGRDHLTWPGEFVEDAIDRATASGDTILAVHSHPGGLCAFSDVDDESDCVLMASLRQGTDKLPGSAIMLPSGAVLARVYQTDQEATPIDLVMQAGPDIHCWWHADATPEGLDGPPMAFTSDMRTWLGRMSVCVIGVSGTGSIVAEQLARLGVGEIILIDFDMMESRNLNRILNSSRADIGKRKVDIFARAIRRYRPDCEVVAVTESIATRDAVLAACEADVIFCCVDTAEGRHVADRLGACFALPLFDVGVSIPTMATTAGRRIAEVYGRVDYVYPGGSSLMDRGVYDSGLLEAEYLAHSAPDALARRISEGYLRGTDEEAPAVISLNMRAAAACVTEFVARLFPFRAFSNEERVRSIFMLAEGDEDTFAERQFVAVGRFPVAVGACEPLLGLPALASPRRVA